MGPPIFIGGNGVPFLRPVMGYFASMGPPIFIGGNVVERHSQAGRVLASMGPPIFIGGNGEDLDAEVDHVSLQWGHRFSSVEIEVAAHVHAAEGQASMGPPIFIGGNELVQDPCRVQHPASMGPPIFIGGNLILRVLTPNYEWLQWGHRFSSVEIMAGEAYRARVCTCFNGATDFHRWKSRFEWHCP